MQQNDRTLADGYLNPLSAIAEASLSRLPCSILLSNGICGPQGNALS